MFGAEGGTRRSISARNCGRSGFKYRQEYRHQTGTRAGTYIAGHPVSRTKPGDEGHMEMASQLQRTSERRL